MRSFCSALFLGFVWFGGVASLRADVIFHVPDQATVVGPKIRLGEVLDVTGDNKALVDKFKRIEIGKAAPAGAKLKLSRAAIVIALRREGIAKGEFSFEGGQIVEVLTQSQDFDPKDLLPDIKNFVLKQTGESREDLQVGWGGGDKKLRLPAGDVSIRLKPLSSGKYEGTVFLTADLEVNGRFIREVPLRIAVDISRPMVATKRPVEKGEKFTASNVEIVRYPSSRLMRGGFNDLHMVLGRSAALSLSAQKLLRMSDISDPPAIHRGEVVQGVVRKGNVELKVRIRAIEEGKVGDSARFENTESHKVIRGKIIDEKTVLIGQ